jgi:hypothetical protein
LLHALPPCAKHQLEPQRSSIQQIDLSKVSFVEQTEPEDALHKPLTLVLSA